MSFCVCCVGTLPLLCATALSGQAIVVDVLTVETQEPVPVAFVTLLDEHGNPIRHGLTNSQGRLTFLLPGAGSFRLRAQIFGRETGSSPTFLVNADETASYRFSLAVEAISLPGIHVESERRCRVGPRDAGEMARVWEEISKALSIQRWTDEVGLYRFRIAAWERDYDHVDSLRAAVTIREFFTTARNPIQSLPLESLMRDGFIQAGEDGRTIYFGPDASLLISDVFLNTHCFRLVEAEELPDAIGLSFEPVGHETSDIKGTLWVDRESAHLRFLQFQYANAKDRLAEELSEGRVEFERLPDGAWIVRTHIPQIAEAISSIFSSGLVVTYALGLRR